MHYDFKQQGDFMKTTLFVGLVLCSQVLFAGEKKCNIVLAVGPDYSWNEQLELPDDYTKKLVNGLEEKGYEVVKQMKIGSWAYEPLVYEVAEKLNAKAIIFRPSLNVIDPQKTFPEYFCRMGIEMEGVSTGFRSISSSILPALFLSTTVMHSILNSIPDCEE